MTEKITITDQRIIEAGKEALQEAITPRWHGPNIWAMSKQEFNNFLIDTAASDPTLSDQQFNQFKHNVLAA